MATGMQVIDIELIRGLGERAPHRSQGALRAAGLTAMRRVRRAVRHVLDMRTEFEVVDPSECPTGLATRATRTEGLVSGALRAAGFAVMRRVRRAASHALDMRTEFEILD
jgi:hypothetical protein